MTNPEHQALQRQLQRYEVRFNAAFWGFWDAHVAPILPNTPVIADVGIGPGLFLRDLSAKLREVTLLGVDSSEVMLANAQSLNYEGAIPTLQLMDVETSPLPFPDGSVDLLTMAAVLHTFEDPFTFLREEVPRVLKPRGRFLLFDWFRQPMQTYIARRIVEPGDPEELRYSRALEQFRAHNKYTMADWLWIISESNLTIEAETSGPHPAARIWLLHTGQ